MFDNKYPYTDFHELNLDWFLAEFKKVHDHVDNLQHGFDDLTQTVNDFKAFVNAYFDNLDVQEEINKKLDAMAADGSLAALIQPLFDEYSDHLDSVINAEFTTQNHALDVMSGRIDQLTSLEEGSTTGDAELADIRVGANGITYANAGDAVRGQYTENNNLIKQNYDQIQLSAIIGSKSDVNIGSSIAGIVNKNGNAQYTEYSYMIHYQFNVTAGDLLTMKAYEQGDANFPFALVYDSSDNIIQRIKDTRSGVVTFNVRMPVNAAYVKMNHNGNTGTASVVKNTQVNSKEYIDDSVTEIKDLLNDVFPFDYQDLSPQPSSSAGVLNYNGNPQYEGTLNYVHYDVNVSAAEKYKIFTYVFNDSNFPTIIARDANNTIIDRVHPVETNQMKSIIYTTPEGCAKIQINHDTNQGIFNIKKGIIEPIEDITGQNYWKGKKIVWFGTSIPAGVVNAGDEGGNGAYPTRIGELLGATVYNESVGSSMVRAGSPEYVTAEDPMGYGGCSAPSLMYSLALSSSEKQDIMDNWDSKWHDIITWYGDQYNPANATAYKNASYDIKLAKYLTGGDVGPVDLYVFDHGYNESIKTYGYTDLETIPNDLDDRKYFIGAMSFLIEQILADNPKARILFIGHYSADQRSGNFLTKYVTDAQEKLAELWEYPLIKTWKLIGWNFIPIEIAGDTTSVGDTWCPDGVHPSSDTTGKSLQHYASVLEPWIRNVR